MCGIRSGVLVLLVLSLYGITEAKLESCPSSLTSKSAELRRCLRHGDKFIKKYLIFLKNIDRVQSGKPFNACRQFGRLQSCLKPFLEQCPRVRTEVLQLWGPVYGNFSCWCSAEGQTVPDLKCQQYNASRSCFEFEYYSYLSEHCDKYYAYSDKYKHLRQCHYLNKRLACRQQRMTSTCGATTGEFAHHITRLMYTRHRGRFPLCNIDPPLEGLSKSSCPDDFLEQMDACEDRHIPPDTPSLLQVYPTNNMVAKGGATDVQIACKNFLRYRRCIKPIAQQCTKEKQMYFSSEGASYLRAYDVKMALICINYTQDYLSNLHCYQDVVVRNLQEEGCKAIWDNLSGLLRSHDAHDLYCTPNNQLSIQLSRLRSCYERVVSSQANCTLAGSAILDILTSKALNDPYYLRMGLVPYCVPAGVTFADEPTSPGPTPPSQPSPGPAEKLPSLDAKGGQNLLEDHPKSSVTKARAAKTFLYSTWTPDLAPTLQAKYVKSDTDQNEINKIKRNPRNSSALGKNGATRTQASNNGYWITFIVLTQSVTMLWIT